MEDIKYKNNRFMFAYRVSAIIYNSDKTKVLLFNGNDRNYYMLPGGKVKELEKSIEAIKREIREETGFDNLEFELVGISEEIIKNNEDNIQQITLTYKTIYNEEIDNEEFKSIESDWINFKWVRIDELNKYEIHPNGVANILNGKNVTKITHIIENKDF